MYRSDVIKKLQASKYSRTSASIQFNLGNVLSEEGELTKAISAYKKAIAILPSFRRAYQNLAYVYVKQEDYEKAFPLLLKVLNLGGNDGSVHGLLGYCFQEGGKYQAALHSFTQAGLTQSEVVDWKLGSAYCLMQLKRLDEAKALYEEITQLQPNNVNVQLSLASVLSQLGEVKQAIIKLESLYRKDALDSANTFLLGTLLLGDGNVRVGAQRLKKVIAKGDYTDVTPALKAVRYSFDLGMLDLAKELYAAIAPDKVEVTQKSAYTVLKAELLLADDQTRAEGYALLKVAVEKEPADDYALLQLGRYYLEEKKYHQAIAILDQAIICKGDYRLASYVEKAQVEVTLKLYADAIVSLKSYLAERENIKIEEYLEAVEALEKASLYQ